MTFLNAASPRDAAIPQAQQLEPDLTLPRVASALRTTALSASVGSLLVGAAVLIGWELDIEVLKRMVPGLTAMNPMTAVAFMYLGCALGIHATNRSKVERAVAIVLAAVVVALGLTRILGLAGVWDPELDKTLFADKLAGADFGRQNRLAPNTAFNLLLLGMALITIDRPINRFNWPAPLLALVAAMASLLAMMGYAYGLPSFYGVGNNIAMALPSALTFLLVAVGVLAARPSHGIMAVFASDTSGGTMIRRLLPAVLVIPVALVGLQLAGQRMMIFDTALGLWLLAITIMTVLTVLVARNAQLLYRSDIDRVTAERTLAHQAGHDALTQLPNRRFFVERLASEFERAHDSQTPAAVLLVDLDLFKVINDSLGHVVGDELLLAAARRIETCLGGDEIAARLGGDEFTVLVPATAGRERAVEVAEAIKKAFEHPFILGLHEVFTSVSIGIAFSEGLDAPADLIRHADIAMYRAKARGKARWEIFDSAMDLAARERLRLENGLRRALARGELRVYYQPEVEIESGQLVGMEALVRWEHPERGLIAPAEFITVAEETGLIVPIGRWVLFEACRQAKLWQMMYRRDLALMVSVNLSGKHLQQASLIDEVREVIQTTGIDPASLIIEITETVAMAGAETTIEVLTKLKSLGVLLAIDDFGTGFSSLEYLKRFPVDMLKIDKSFVAGVANRGHDTAIVEAIIALGHALGLSVIAEGVETPDQLMELRALGSELGQGYFFGHPLSSDESSGMPPLLEAHRRWNADGGGQRVN